MKKINDKFTLYDLKVEIVKDSKPFVCSHKEGDYFTVSGENISFPEGLNFSLYSLAALLPLIPAKQRPTHENDWMTTDALIACPDPNCGALFKISRIKKRVFKHSDTTVVPLKKGKKNV